MITIRQKSININRKILLATLKDNLDAHTAEYLDALADYKIVITKKLEEALALAKSSAPDKTAEIRVNFAPPPDHRQDYQDAIEMLEFSADDNINLDQESFKAYVKNEWIWTRGFREMAMSNKLAASL